MSSHQDTPGIEISLSGRSKPVNLLKMPGSGCCEWTEVAIYLKRGRRGIVTIQRLLKRFHLAPAIHDLRTRHLRWQDELLPDRTINLWCDIQAIILLEEHHCIFRLCPEYPISRQLHT